MRCHRDRRALTISALAAGLALSGGVLVLSSPAFAGTVDQFQVGPGGSLTQVGELTGLMAPMEGIAAS